MGMLKKLRALGPGYELASAAANEIERLRSRVDALETYVAAVKEVRDNAVIGAEKRAIASEYGRIVGNGPTDEAERKRMLIGLEDRCARLGGHEIIPTEERWACAYCGAAETPLDELSRLGQEVDAQLTPEDHEAIQATLRGETPNAKTQAAMDDVQGMIDAREGRHP